jgi:hypothetical protein
VIGKMKIVARMHMKINDSLRFHTVTCFSSVRAKLAAAFS